MYESRFFIIKAKSKYEILQNDGTYSEYLRDGIWFKTKRLAEKYLKENIENFTTEMEILEVWM